MVICCVPACGSDSWICDPTITFHEFPPNPDLAAKWIKQINNALQKKPMWFPRGKPLICSKHFLQTDFKPDSDALKPRCVPTVFGFKYIGANPDMSTNNKVNNTKSPLIVKVLRPEQKNNRKPNANTFTNLPSQSNSVSMVNQQKSFYVNKSPRTYNGYRRYDRNNMDVLTDQIRKKLNEFGQDIASKNNTVPNALKVNGTSTKKTIPRKKAKLEEDVIEIGPNTFLKINPDVIKVNKKQTPSGNTVLQFIMDQKLASNSLEEFLPKVIQGDPKNVEQSNSSKSVPVSENDDCDKSNSVKEPVVQHVVGHLVDTHVCRESCPPIQVIDDIEMEEDDMNDEGNVESEGTCLSNKDKVKENSQSHSPEDKLNDNSDAIAKAPVLLTTNVPLAHCYMEKPKYLTQLKQKSRQIASLKAKIANLTKKIEELEDRCIVQERQLSYSFVKRLKVIRKNAGRGDPSATYVLEQIRAYSGTSRMRWSDSTLSQCAIWCRKAPYAYEYFKKANFFKLPCLGTVKRYMKKHPEIKFQKKVSNNGQNADDESSSDFDFDESDDFGEQEDDEQANCNTQVSGIAASDAGETIGSETVPQTAQTSVADKGAGKTESCVNNAAESIVSHKEERVKSDTNLQLSNSHTQAQETTKEIPVSFPVTVNSSNLEVQEIVLPSGEIVQCYSSSVCNGDVGGQYYIIPNVSDQHSAGDHEYSVVQTESLHILQNLEASQIPVQQEQLIFITDSTEQVECSETEVVTA